MRGASTLATILAVLAVGGPVCAQELAGQARVDAAEEAYDAGVRHFEAREFMDAGAAFERADALLPARVAMENAIRAYREAGDDRRAATVATALVERDVSARRQARFVPEVARTSFEITVSCDAECTITVDGEETRYRTFFFAPNEPHFFRATFETGVRETASTGQAGEERTLVFEAPAADARPLTETNEAGDNQTEQGREEATDDGSDLAIVPLWVTLTAAAVTLGVVGVTVWSAVDTDNARSAYDLSPTLEGLEDGQSKELRTNILLGASIGMGVVTAALAILTDWSFGDEAEEDGAAVRFGVGPMDAGAIASISGRLR